MTSEQSSESKERCACVFDVSLPIELVAGWMDGFVLGQLVGWMCGSVHNWLGLAGSSQYYITTQ